MSASNSKSTQIKNFKSDNKTEAKGVEDTQARRKHSNTKIDVKQGAGLWYVIKRVTSAYPKSEPI